MAPVCDFGGLVEEAEFVGDLLGSVEFVEAG